MNKIRWNMVWGIGITVVFLGLLAIRLDLFREKHYDTPVISKAAAVRAPESWMNIYQKKNKIGAIHRKFIIMENGHFQTEEFATMQINTMGVLQTLNLATETELNPDLTLSSFNFELNSSLFRFVANGYISKDKLFLSAGLPNALEKTVIPLKDIPHISGNIYEAAFRGGLEKSRTREFSIFDPSTMGLRKISLTRQADEIIPIMGSRILTQKFCADFMGAKNCAWLAKDGEVLKETGILGLSMEKVSEREARSGMTSGEAVDFTEVASIPSNITMADPAKLSEIKIRIGGIPHLSLMLHGGRQKLQKGILTITKESLSDASATNDLPVAVQRYLLPSSLVQSRATEMKAQADKIVLSTDHDPAKLRKIVHWVYRSIQKKPVLSVPNALEVLKNKTGDCNEHAVLTAALLRASGIPTQIEAGLVYLNGRFYYHAWNIAYVGKWITVDSVFDQIPADITHIRLVRGEGGEQLDLLGVMGKIKLEVISTSHD